MSNIHQWLVSNKLTLNVEKTEYMVIGTHKRLSRFSQDTTVSIDGKVIKQVNSKKTLGVIIDENLCWDKQIENISKKGVGMLRRVKPFVSIGTLTYLYQALVQPHFDYCSMVWDNCGKTLKGMLQRLQNRAARVIVNVYFARTYTI
jgi:phage terminase large subunit-like protein